MLFDATTLWIVYTASAIATMPRPTPSMRRRCQADGRSGAARSGRRRADPALYSDPPQRSCRRPTQLTGPATGEPDRSSAAPHRTSGTRNAASEILILLALGFALRLIIAYILPGSGFRNDLDAFQFWASKLAELGPARLLQARLLHRLHARLPVRLVGDRHHREVPAVARPDQDPGDPGRHRRRRPHLVDGPGARRRPARRARWSRAVPLHPGHLVRQRRMGPGRFGRSRVPPARDPLPVARPAGARGRLHGDRRRSSRSSSA